MKFKWYKAFYIFSLIMFTGFLVMLILGYIQYSELLSNPLVMVAPFSSFVKNLCARFSIVIVSLILGVVFHIIDKKKNRK